MSICEEAPASAVAGNGTSVSKYNLGALFSWSARALGTWRNRRMVANMRDFDDAQLADIGLSRRDVETALQAPLGVQDREALERQVGVDGLDAVERARPRHGRQAAGQHDVHVARSDVARIRELPPNPPALTRCPFPSSARSKAILSLLPAGR